MNGYLLSVIGTVLLCSLLTAIAPEGKTSTVIKGVTRLACILVIIAPVLQFFKTGSFKGLFDEKGDNIFAENVIRVDEEFINYYSEKRVRQTELALEKELSEKYSVTVEVTVDWSTEKETFGGGYEAENIRVDRIRILLRTQTQEEVIENMRRYVQTSYCSEVLIE